MPFLVKGGLCFLATQPHQKYYVDTVKKDICKDVCEEPQLQQLTSEYLQHLTAAGNQVRLVISAHRFWQGGQVAFLDVRVFNPNAKQYANIEVSKAYEINEKEKKQHIPNAWLHASG